jgi:hypothetical protein
LPKTSSAQLMLHVGIRGGCRQAVVSANLETGDAYRIGGWGGQRVQRSSIGDALMRPVGVVEPFELSQRAQ